VSYEPSENAFNTTAPSNSPGRGATPSLAIPARLRDEIKRLRATELAMIMKC
jgi:hypothetical protein